MALLEAQEQVDPLAELLVFAADRAQHVRTQLIPAINLNHVVLSDRYADATVADQGAGRGFDQKLIGEIVELATGGLKPDLTLVFDLPVAESAARTKRRADKRQRDRLDFENPRFHRRVRKAYLRMAKAEPERVRIIDSRGPVEETHALVMEIVMPFLKERGLLTEATDH